MNRRSLCAGLAGVVTLLAVGATAGEAASLTYIRDDREARFIGLVRNLDDRGRGALLGMMHRVMAGEPMLDSAVLFYCECGMEEEPARKLAEDSLRRLGYVEGGAP